MASCEKCWSDSYQRAITDTSKNQTEHYISFLEERYNSPCTAEEQAGEDRSYCNRCERWTVHQHTHQCVICEKD